MPHALRSRGKLPWLALAVAMTAALWAMASAASAQTVRQAVPPGSPIPRIAPAAPPEVGPGLPPPAAPGALGAQGDATVAVRSVSVEDATAYTPARFAAITAGLPGTSVKLSRIEAARQAILDLYRADGFVLSAVSARLEADGRLRFLVTEGRIATVRLDGDIGPAGAQVLRFLQRLTEARPIDAATLERYLLLAQDVPGVSVHAVLRPSTEEPGALALVAQVQRKPVGGLVTLDNRAYGNTGPEQGLAVLDFNSFSSLGERTELSLYDTAGSTQVFGQVSEEAFLGGSGLKLRLYGGTGRANPWGQLGALGYAGATTVGGISVSYPLLRSRQQILNLAALFDLLDEDIRTSTGPDSSHVPASKDAVRALRGAADYAREDRLLGDGRPAVNAATLRLSQGMPILGASRAGEVLAARLAERPDFFKANAEISRTQTLFHPWAGGSVALYGLLAGQASASVLPPSEKFFLGGNRLNRGFYAGQVTGDNAIATSIELQLNTDVSVVVFGTTIDMSPQFYGFYDWGETWENQRLDLNRRLASVGGGARLGLTQFAELDLEGASRLTRQPQGAGATQSAVPASAFYWRVLARF